MKNALIKLMAKKDFEKITINEIAEEANVNRGTVYLHFVDKYDLLDKCVESSLLNLNQYCNENSCDSPKESLTKTFEYIEKNAFLYNTLLTKSGALVFYNMIKKMMMQRFKDQIELNDKTNGMKKDVLVQFITSACIGVLEWWFLNNMPYSASEITDQLIVLLQQNKIFI